MKGTAVALVLALVMVAGPAGATQSTYVHLLTAPEFQYQSDEAVRVRFQTQLVQSNVPAREPVRIEVFGEDGQPFPLASGRDYLAGGVRPYPAVNYIDFGRLDAGLYTTRIKASAGGLTAEQTLGFSVVLPPVPYAADLQGGKRDATFFFEPRDSRPYTITVYQDAPGGRVVIDEVSTNKSAEIHVPYVPGEPVKVDVEDPHGWTNHENRRFDPITGSTVYGPWIWYPDYKNIEQVRDTSPWNAGIAAGLIGLVAAGFLYMRRRP